MIVLQEIFTENIKISNMTIKLTPHLKKDRIVSKLQEQVRNMLLSQKQSFKVTNAVIFNIDNHDKEILSVGYEDKKFKQKTNGIN